MREKHWGETHLKKRGLASLLIVSIIAIAAVIGVIYAFQNGRRQSDIYGSIVVTVDKPEVKLEIELEKDETTDSQFRVKDTAMASTLVKVTVAGLPDSADRRAKLSKDSISNGIVSVERVTSDGRVITDNEAEEAGKTGVNLFRLTGLNAGKANVEFTTFGNRTVTVAVTVNMEAKDMRLSATSHFGVRQGGEALNLKSADILSKYVFYAHPEADEYTYKPNIFPVEYKLKENYSGINLTDGMLTVTSKASAYVNDFIELQVKLASMDHWLTVPFYVFPSVNKILIDTDAYQSKTTAYNPKIWDLIANRTDLLSANFTFALDCEKTETSYYGFDVKSREDAIARVDYIDLCQRSISAMNNLGEVAINITAYPITKINGKVTYYNDAADANVQITDTIYMRVRNEFYREDEVPGLSLSYNLVPSKSTLDAYYYEGTNNQGNYFDTFTLDTGNGNEINLESDVEFELVVEDSVGDKSGIYNWSSDISIFSILQIRYWSVAANDWVVMSEDNHSVKYLNRFSVAFTPSSALAENFISPTMSLTLRIKSVNELSIGGYASCDIDLEVTSAIDQFEVKGLTQFDDGAWGVALVYDNVSFIGASVEVYGQYADINGEKITYENSQTWDVQKVSFNEKELSVFKIGKKVVENKAGVKGKYHIVYEISADSIDPITYYVNYPMTIQYTNGKSYTFYIRVYPTVDNLSMSVVSADKGKIYQTITHNNYTKNYDYVRTVYVRKGYTYQFAINTPNVAVGAYAMFDTVFDADGNPISQIASNLFDARKLPEGLYECSVSLHAYSDAVYSDNPKSEILVYMIVVDPIGDVTIQPEVILDGIGAKYPLELKLKSLDDVYLGADDFTYLHINLIQTNDNVVVKRSNGDLIRLNDNIIDEGSNNKIYLEAKYLTKESFEIGFRIYKSYEFSDEKFNLDGEWTPNKPFEFYYIGGAMVSTKVTIRNVTRTSISLGGYVDNGDNMKQHVRLISGPTATDMTTASISFNATNSNSQAYGITYAKWENGKFNLAAFDPTKTDDLDINGFATARFNAVTGKIDITPVANKVSLGVYALVVYTRDSLRYVEKVNGVEYTLPDNYEWIPLYIGSQSDIEEVVAELAKENTHDANSGVRNDRGGFNWVASSSNHPDHLTALLFYTPKSTNGADDNYGSAITANKYYLDDLYTVLGDAWKSLKTTTQITVKKFVYDLTKDEPEEIGSQSYLQTNVEKNRLYIDLDGIYNLSDNGAHNGELYSSNGTIVYYEVQPFGGSKMTFYVAQYINTFDVTIESLSNNHGWVARTNLDPKEYVNTTYNITMQRGNEFWFSSNLDEYSGWKFESPNFDSEERSKTGDVSYEGGIYSFTPYIEFNLGTNYKFTFDVLTAKVKVDVKGGVNYLNISQDSISLDGVTTATYDLIVRVDQKTWNRNILTYNFLYDGIYYPLFADGNVATVDNSLYGVSYVTYVNMEGGKAKLEFKLTCLNASDPSISSTFYYTYYLKIEVAVVVVSPDVDPFYDISGARLFVEENLDGSALAKVKTPVKDSAAFNLTKQGVYNVTMAHFAETKAVESNKSALTLTSGQTNSGVIYLDNDSKGGILVVYPTPYYINVYNINLWTSQPHTEKVLIGTDLSGNPIYDTVTYSIGFTQMIYNEQEKYYQPYISGSSTPKMVSSWSPAEGYKWTGKYYFRTYIVASTQVSHRLSNGTRFGISISIQGESNAKAITETMILDAKYRDSFMVEPDDDTEDYAICTMSQTRYQALGTKAVYDIAFPSDCVPNYANFTFNNIATASMKIDLGYATATINSVAQTLTITLMADATMIGKTLEIRIPYNRPGDYVNPYLSVVVVPVYFEFDSLEVIGHYESIMRFANEDEKTQLKYRALFNYDTSMSSTSLTDKMNAFNNSLKSADKSLLIINYETAKQITVQIPYSYVNGVPVLTKNGTCRYERTFYYTVDDEETLVERTEYLAVGTSATYTFYNWDSLYSSMLYLEADKSNDANVAKYWSANLSAQGNTVNVTVKLDVVSSNAAYKALISAGQIVINIFANTNRVTPQLQLKIVPVYFTFSEFKLYNYPVSPLVALSTPTQLTVEAGGIVAADDVDVTNEINNFNKTLFTVQNNLANSTTLSFSRVPNDDGVLNFNFDANNRTLTRADTANPITATSYLLIAAGIKYVAGRPTLDATGERISTYLPVRTYGSGSDESGSGDPSLDLAPSRVRTVAQAIGTEVRYNIAVPGVSYDSWLDRYEITADGNQPWDKAKSQWNAIFNHKNGVIAVNLKDNTDLFNKILTIKAYDQDGELAYALRIVPAYFTVEQILLAEHIDEIPVMIKEEDNWLTKLKLDFATNHANQTFEDFDFDAEIEKFRAELTSSSLVSRIDDAGYITVIAGVNYGDGIPHVVNSVNSVTTVQNTYRYIFVEGTPENTRAQALGGEGVYYNVNRTVGAIKISTKTVDGKDVWEDNRSGYNTKWSVDRDLNNPRRIKVWLSDDSTEMIGQRIRIGIFTNPNDEEPSYILNILPTLFTVDNLALEGQTVDDRDIYMYYGENPSSPDGLRFDAIFGANSTKASLNIAQNEAAFTKELKETKAHLIGRSYDKNLSAGDLHITLYVDYQHDVPTLVSATEAAGNPFVIRLDYDFTYAIYGRPEADGTYPPMPSGPRTRTEVQAIGTINSYTIDLNKSISMDVDYLKDDMTNTGWRVTFENNVLTVELSADANKTEALLKKDLVFDFYVGYELVFELTIQPVLFEVIGVETIYPEQPFYMASDDLNDIEYRAVTKYNSDVKYKENSVVQLIETFNTRLNAAKGDLLEATIEGQYLKVDIAVDYGPANSEYRTCPALINVENYPLNVVESYLAFTKTSTSEPSATHYQAIGTTEYYYLGAGFEEGNNVSITINGNGGNSEDVSATVVKYGNSYALKVILKANVDLVKQSISININHGESAIFKMTIKPVWFLVEGFDVIGHPEQHMWLITSETKAEKVSDLLFRVRARYTTDTDVQTNIQEQLDTFNHQLAELKDGEWTAKEWANWLETYTLGGEYLVVRAAIEYDANGVAKIINMDQANPTQVVRDAFKYARYSDQVIGSGLAYPSIPRSRIVELTIGYSAEYTLDLPNLKTGFTKEMISVFENSASNDPDDDNNWQYITSTGSDTAIIKSDDWTMTVNGKKLTVQLEPHASLVNREIKVFIYKDRNSVSKKADSYDAENVVFILTIRPVWYKVTGFTLTGYPDDTIYVKDVTEFMTKLTMTGNGIDFVPVYEYSQAVLNDQTPYEDTTSTGAYLKALMDKFTSEFMSSSYVTKTRTRENASTYYFQVTTSIAYTPYVGTAVLTDETANRIWQTFEIKVDANADSHKYEERTEYQAIGTTKTYYIDSKVLEGVESIESQEGKYKVIGWGTAQDDETEGEKKTDVNNPKHYLTIELSENVEVTETIEVKIGANFTLKINPVYYEILGFETVESPERAVWILSPNTVMDVRYRAITTKIPTTKDAETAAKVQESLDNLNVSLNNGNAPVSITYDSNEYIVFDAAINYVNGYPTIVEITNDKRNVVESIIPYRVWSSTQKPKPEQPTVVGTTQANQIIGTTKLYTLKNIKGQVFYQYLWVENAGSLLTAFDKSTSGTIQTYEGLSILVDSAKGTLEIQLAESADYLSKTIRIYLPYLTSVNGKEVWYSHCVEITPLLFELIGWTIEAADKTVAASQLIKDPNHDDYLLLTTLADPTTIIRYVPRIIECKTSNPDLIRMKNVAIARLEEMAFTYLNINVLGIGKNIGFEDRILRLNIPANAEPTDNYVEFRSYVVYENGVPQLVESSKYYVYNQILISTGYQFDEWTKKEKDPLGSGVNYAVQAVGTEAVYMVEINSAAQIFTDEIKVVDQATQKTIAIQGERVNLVTVEAESTDNPNIVMLTVDMAPVIALCTNNITVEIKIPFTEDVNAKNADHSYSYYITPVMYIVEGFYLASAEGNYLDLTDREVALELHAKVSYSDDVSVRNMVNLVLQSFESSVNNAIRSEAIQFDVINGTGGINVRLEAFNNTIWIQKIGDKTALNYLEGTIKIGYSGGMPQLGTVNPMTDAVMNVQIQVHTQQGATNYFPGWNNVVMGNSSQFLQSIGTSRNYPLNVNDANVVFYYEYIEVFNGGYKSGENEYEYFAYQVVNPGRQNLTLGFTLKTNAKTLNDWIDIRVPYTNLVEGKVVWAYYSLKIKPILFEIKSWKLKVGDELVDSVTLDDSAVELYFSPEIVSGPLNQTYYSADELNYIQSAIKRLETEINTYDPKISDGYTYMVINNTAQEGYQINYTIYHEDSTNTSYMLRDTAESSTTIMQISANISYGVTDFSKEYVEGAQAVTAYAETENAQRIMGQISIYTTDKSISDSAGDRSTVFITQDNAARLMALNSGVDYVLMSDINLNEISGLNNGKWRPVDFPVNTTLDGNNFKIFFNNRGFDLSGNPTNIGMFTAIPNGSVVKNVQIVLEQGTPSSPITELKVDLSDYAGGSVNVGTLAGVNNGIITNCAVLSGWQFNMQNLTEIENPVTGNNFEGPLPFNKDGLVFDKDYFYEIGLKNGKPAVTHVYNSLGYGVTADQDGRWIRVVYDIYGNVADWIAPDRTNVARYDGYSPILFNESASIDSVSSGKLYVYANNEGITVTMGGLVGTNDYMMTNSRVLIDVELYGPAQRTDAGQTDDINVMSSSVGGVAGINGGTITTTYFRDGSVINNSKANTLDGRVSLLGGFVGQNTGVIQQSYAMGRSTNRETNLNYISTAGAVKTIRNSLGGFVHINSGVITDCLVNMVIYKTGTEGAAGGFVYQNTAKGTISNCVENNDIILQSGSTLDYYAPFVYLNGESKTTGKTVNTANLSNLIYAGNAEGISFSNDWKGTLKHLTNNSNNANEKYANINNYEGFSIGQAQNDNGVWGIAPDNTIWMMTDVGPMLREANEITVSYRKYTWGSSPYLYAPGTAKNPYLIWTADQFNDYVYAATAHATEADKGAESNPVTNIESSRQNNHLRLVDNVTLDGIQDTYKIIYTGTFEGNGLTMSGISLDTVTNDLATMGLFGKTEYATIRNINFEIGNINSTARYVGGIAGIAINTSFVDVKVLGAKATDTIKGANLVGGFVGLNVVNDTAVENYNLHSSVAVVANFHSQQTDVGAAQFSSGKEYYQQTLYAKVEALDISYEQGFGAAGGVFGFVTANPNNYRVVDNSGNVTIYSRKFTKNIIKQDASGKIIDQAVRSSANSEAAWFLKDRAGNVINDEVKNGKGLYYMDPVILRNVSGAVPSVSGNVAGGLIGIMDETVELRKPALTTYTPTTKLTLTGKYYLGGLVGINLGKISGGITKNADGSTTTYSTMDLNTRWDIVSSAGSSYVFRDNPSTGTTTRFWGMTVGAVVGYNDGFYGNLGSGVIENINVNVNVLTPTSSTLQYAIGGVVGGIGEYSYLDNTTNTNSNINFTGIRVTLQHIQKIGFYFGRIVGRGSASNTSTTGNSTTARMTTMKVNVPYYNNTSFVSATDFETSDYYDSIDNAFGIIPNATLKVQTMTLEEYREYLKTVITGPGAGNGSSGGTGSGGSGSGSGSGSGNEDNDMPGLPGDQVPPGDWQPGDNPSGGGSSGSSGGATGGGKDGFPSLDFANKDLVTRVDLLEPLLRNISTYYTTATINGVKVRVEKFNADELSELMSYINLNHIFDAWDGTHEAIPGFSEKVKANYQSYVEYSAVSTKPASEESERDFAAKLEIKDVKGNVIGGYRYERYQRAYTLFTYQYRVSESSKTINGAQNASFTWRQYEEYTVLKEYAKSSHIESVNTKDATYQTYAAFKAQFGEKLAKLVYPQKAEVEYLGGSATTVTGHVDFLNMKAAREAKDEKDNYTFNDYYGHTDPLQVYLNYVTGMASENNPFSVSGGWTMSLSQYYYYMAHIYGQEYPDELTTRTKYTAPKDFPATGERGYVSYLYLNVTLIASGSDSMSIAEFINMMVRETTIVIENETNWIKNGHMSSTGVRISDIGGVTMWFSGEPEKWDDAARKLVTVENGGIIIYDNGLENDKDKYQWPAMTNYINAKAELGLTIGKYKEIVNLGGSLYKLVTSDIYKDYENEAADIYIFNLKSEQYNWTSEQSKYISEHYQRQDGSYDLLYALSATTNGRVVEYMSYGNVRAVYKTDAQSMDDANGWYTDNNGNGRYDGATNETVAEPRGEMTLTGTQGATFVNGDGVEYRYNSTGTIYLNAVDGQGAAMYVDVDGDKLFTSGPTSKDILIIYNAANEAAIAGSDFYREGANGEKTYYKIARQAVKKSDRVMTDEKEEETNNTSDYLEEARWWMNNGFTAAEFDQIKAATMFVSIPQAGRVKKDSSRDSGFTVADDWYSAEKYSGFSQEYDFTAGDYVDIVTNARYVQSGNNWIWYSNYADYQLFKKIYNVESIDTKEINTMIPTTSKFNNPFLVNGKTEDMLGNSYADLFMEKVALEVDLADAIEFDAVRPAYLALLTAEGTTANYVTWSQNLFKYTIKVENNQKWKDEDRYFRLNHYIYYMQEKLGSKYTNFKPDDFKWVLSNDIRMDIFYSGVTQAKRTTDLVEYRCNWYNNGDPYITFRDYCEWINIYAYSDDYRQARGDFEDTETGETLTSTDGWLTIDAFAVWKRMEKYENNVEYLAKIATTAGQNPIKAPIYKRKISTTVFPRIYSSGEQSVNDKGIIVDKDYVFPEQGIVEESDDDDEEDKVTNDFLIQYYNWGYQDNDGYVHHDSYAEHPMDFKHERPVQDRFEYNERYTIFDIDRIIGIEEGFSAYSSILRQAQTLINDQKFSKDCDMYCGGISVDSKGKPSRNPSSCNDHTHAAYQARRWYERYGIKFDPGEKKVTWIYLDEAKFYTTKTIKLLSTDKEVKLDSKMYTVTNQYTQLYIPYTNFAQACQLIKSAYSNTPDFKGYFNYMKYWAKHGDPNWICVYPSNNEYDGPLDGKEKVSNTYLATAFWNSNTNGDKSPL